MDSQSRRLPWLVLGLTLLGAALRLDGLAIPSLWWDEFITLGNALTDLPRMWRVLADWGMTDVGAEFFPPLLHTLLHAIPGLEGNDVAARLPSVLFGVLSIPAIYALARRLFGAEAGVAAAFLLATSGYHIHYSREVRPYTLYLLLNIAALIFLHAGAMTRHVRAFIPYALLMAAMFYTSYMSGTVAASHVAFALAILGPEALRGGPGATSARRALAAACLAWAFALAVYAPWLPHQFRLFAVMRDPANAPMLSVAFLASAFREFSGFAFRGDASLLLLVPAVLGAAACLRAGRRRELLMLSLWALMPLLGIVFAKTRFDLSSRYIINVFLFSLTLSATALAQAGIWASTRLAIPGFFKPFVSLSLTLILAGACAFPSLSSLPDYRMREPSFYKQVMEWLLENKNNADLLVFPVNRGPKTISRWYLGGVYRSLQDFSPDGYKRARLLAPSSFTPDSDAPLLLSGWDFTVRALGLANASPITLSPGPTGEAVHTEDFSTFSFYRDCLSARNMAPDLIGRSLSHYDYARPAEAVYAFQTPEGSDVRSAALELHWRGQFIPSIEPEAGASLWLSLDGETFDALDCLTAQDFLQPDGKLPALSASIRRRYELGGRIHGAKRFFLKIAYAPITRMGAIELAGLTLSARLAGPPPAPAAVAAQAMSAAAARNTLLPWREGVVLTDSLALHAFAHPGAASLPGVGFPEDLRAFREQHPDLPPVLTIPFPDGQPAYSLYDPALADPFVACGPGRPVTLEMGEGSGTRFKALKLRGQLNAPHLTLGKASFDVPVASSLPGVLTANAGGRAELVLSPLFTQEDFPEAVQAGRNLKQSPAEQCLTCEQDRPCSMEIEIRSDWPITGFRLVNYPRIFADPEYKSAFTTRYAVDDGPHAILDEYVSNASRKWEGWKIRRIHAVTLAKPARRLRMRFDLSGQDAQLWSAPDARMRLEVEMDASSLTQIRPGTGLAHLVSDQPMGVFFLPGHVTFPDRLRPAH